MGTEIIAVNDEFLKYEDAVAHYGMLPGYDFVYQHIHTLAHRPLHAKAHLDILDISCERLYGVRSGLTTETLAKIIGQLLKHNRYPEASNLVAIYLLPPEKGSVLPSRVFICEKQLLYRGYVVWHKAFKAIVTPYEYPFPEHKTAVARTAHIFPKGYAERSGADIAITANQTGIVTGAGEYPFFAVRGDMLFTTPLDGYGVAESVERRLAIAAAETIGVKIIETPLESKGLKEFDELFIADPQGVVSIGEYGGKLYPSSIVKHIAAHMNNIILK